MTSHTSLRPESGTAFPAATWFETSIILPCRNEAGTLAACLAEIWSMAKQHALALEVIVVDSDSTDETRSIAEAGGARVVSVARRGYGNALMAGIRAAWGRFVILGDAGGSYDFNDVPRLLRQLRLGYELVMGNRFLGGIQRRAMPPLSRYLSNPVLSTMSRVLFNLPLRDFYCDFRGCSRQAVLRWQLTEPGAAVASEMIIKAAWHKASITEVPVSLRPDRRLRPAHSRFWGDAWQQLKLMSRYFMQSPSV